MYSTGLLAVVGAEAVGSMGTNGVGHEVPMPPREWGVAVRGRRGALVGATMDRRRGVGDPPL
jgi:hypothetical protein